jgi:hypothetical protein
MVDGAVATGSVVFSTHRTIRAVSWYGKSGMIYASLEMSDTEPTLQSPHPGAKTDEHVDAVDEKMNPRTSFEPLSGTEYEKAIALLVESGFEPAEFLLEQQRFDAQGASAMPHVSKMVSVIRLPIGLHRRYTAGKAGTWPGEFERDLRCGTYGDPAMLAERHGSQHPPPQGG